MRPAGVDDARDLDVDHGRGRHTRRFSAVRWGVAGNIVFAWIRTIPAAAGVAALVWTVLDPLLS